MNLSVVIPCYNEAENIPILIKKILDTYKPQTEIIFVNNGSTDNTKELLLKEIALTGNSSFRVVNIDKNIGYGHGIMSGLMESNGEIMSWTHADLQTDINDVYLGYNKLIEHSNKKKTFLKGNRRKRFIFDNLLTWGMGKIASTFLGYNFKDINAQPKMFHKSFLNLVNESPDDFSLDLYFYFIALKENIKILELPVYFNDRLYGEAKGGGGSSLLTRIKIIMRTLKYIRNLRKRLIS